MNRNPKQVINDAKRVSNHATSDDPRAEDARDIYVPYETSSHPQERMRIIRQNDTMHYPSYRYLMDIIHTESYDGIVLVYSFLMVKVTGRNLEDLIDHIAQGGVLFIQKFDARKWRWPEEGQPIIEAIEIVTRSDSEVFKPDKKPRPVPGGNEYH